MQLQPEEEWREDALLLELGTQLLAGEQRAFPPEPAEAVAAARAWLKRQRAELARRICPNEDVQKLVRGDRRSELAAAIADLIAALCKGLPVFTVARLLVIYGIETLCAEQWQPEG
ncbi:MAG: hypothetical protein KC591_15840 [Gemmatimonadetes bacterium]|nr:hypothetical protein [Phycisphaerales bacterium]MCA9753667.1 hypothetical protein [Gemmatimonadota bacterium]